MNAPEKIHALPSRKPTPGLDPRIERSEKRLRYMGIISMVVLFGGLGTWSALAPLDSAAIGPGVVVLENYRMAVDHLEGGIVAEVHAREGQWAKKGEVLVTLQDVQPRAQLEQIKGQWFVAVARESRLLAQRDGKGRVTFPKALLDNAKDPRAADAMRVQEKTFSVRRRALQGEITLYERQIAQLQEKTVGLRDQRAMRERLVDSFEKERGDFEALAREWSLADPNGAVMIAAKAFPVVRASVASHRRRSVAVRP